MKNLIKTHFFKALSQVKYGTITIRDETDDTVTVFGNYGDGEARAVIVVKDRSLYKNIYFNGSTGAGESFIQGHWTSPDLVDVIRFFSANIEITQDLGGILSILHKIAGYIYHRLNDPTEERAKDNIERHYDLSNDFYKLFLDPTMSYSAPIYRHDTQSLHEASINKLIHVAERLDLKSTDHVVEIGTGWGGMATFIAEHYGCRVVTVTITREQYLYTNNLIKEKNLQHLVECRFQDYRDLEGTFDKLICIEVIESIGHRFYTEFFTKISDLLKPDGLALMQAITISDQRYLSSLSRNNFIKQFVFPGGECVSTTVITNHLTFDTDMMIVGMEDISLSYAMALKSWRESFLDNLDDVCKLPNNLFSNPEFHRMWEFYLAFCEGSLLERVVQTSQYLLAKPRCKSIPTA